MVDCHIFFNFSFEIECGFTYHYEIHVTIPTMLTLWTLASLHVGVPHTLTDPR